MKQPRDNSPLFTNPTIKAPNTMVHRLFTACGVDGEFPPGDGALSAARRIREMLQKFAIGHPGLSVLLSEYETRKLETLEAASEEMLSDESKVDVRMKDKVKSARATVETCWPAVLVTASQGAVSQLYLQLALHQPSQTQESRKLLQQMQVIRNCSARRRWSSTEDWHELERLITSLLDATENSKPFAQAETLEHSFSATEEVLFSTIALPEAGRTLLADELLGEKRGNR